MDQYLPRKRLHLVVLLINNLEDVEISLPAFSGQEGHIMNLDLRSFCRLIETTNVKLNTG